MQNTTELAHTPIQKNNFSFFIKNICSCVAQFFQCDQRFQQLEIVPHQVYYLRDQNTLLTDSAREQINRDPEDNRVIYNESSRWDKFSTWKAWQFWLCCHRQQNIWLDEGTEYDPREIKIVNQEKYSGYFQNDCQKQHKRHDTISEKSIIVFQNDSQFDKNENKDSSILSNIDYSNILKLNPHEQKVSSKQTQLKNNKKSKRSINIQDLSNNVPDSTKAQCNDQLNKIKQISNKTKIKSQSNNKQENSQKYLQPKTQNIHYHNQIYETTSTQQLKNQELFNNSKPINNSSLNAQDDFNQLGQAISISQQQKQNKHFKSTIIDPKMVSSNNLNFNDNKQVQFDNSEIVFQKQKSSFFEQKHHNTQPIFQNSQSLQEDGFIKKKKKIINIFNEDVLIEGVEIIQNQAPSDLVKKRKRRNRLILNQQKDKQIRASKRQQEKQKQQLQIIIYSNSQGDD